MYLPDYEKANHMYCEQFYLYISMKQKYKIQTTLLYMVYGKRDSH